MGEEIYGGDFSCDALLLTALLKMVDRDDYYFIKAIKEKMFEELGEKPNWLNERWVSNALKRLGFREKRRIGKGSQVRLTPKMVNTAASKMLPPEALIKIYETMKDNG